MSSLRNIWRTRFTASGNSGCHRDRCETHRRLLLRDGGKAALSASCNDALVIDDARRAAATVIQTALGAAPPARNRLIQTTTNHQIGGEPRSMRAQIPKTSADLEKSNFSVIFSPAALMAVIQATGILHRVSLQLLTVTQICGRVKNAERPDR
jgi:hypothetical protein